MAEPLRLGQWRPMGQITCSFGLADPDCPKPATHHLMWMNDLSVSNACDEHFAYILAKDTSATPFETHPFEGDCSMPGALWHHPAAEETEGRCVFPLPDDLRAAVSVEVAEPVQVAP